MRPSIGNHFSMEEIPALIVLITLLRNSSSRIKLLNSTLIERLMLNTQNIQTTKSFSFVTLRMKKLWTMLYKLFFHSVPQGKLFSKFLSSKWWKKTSKEGSKRTPISLESLNPRIKSWMFHKSKICWKIKMIVNFSSLTQKEIKKIIEIVKINLWI